MNTASCFKFDTYNSISAECDSTMLSVMMDRCSSYDGLLSKTVRGSDVWRINHADGESVQVSADTSNILLAARAAYEDSGGAFNVAVAPVMELWDFKGADPRVPCAAAIADAVARCRLEGMVLARDEVTVPAGMQVDFGGIAKGYIVDRVVEELESRGVERAVLNFGGTIATIGAKEDGSPWSFGLQTPFGAYAKDYWATVESCEGALATSGVYERGFELDGVRYHHIIDPRTGWPVQNGLLSVTVWAPNALTADILSTSLFVLGPEDGIALAQRLDCEAVYLDESHKATYTSGMRIRMM